MMGGLFFNGDFIESFFRAGNSDIEEIVDFTRVDVFSGLATRTRTWDHVLSRRTVEFGRWDDGRFILQR